MNVKKKKKSCKSVEFHFKSSIVFQVSNTMISAYCDIGQVDTCLLIFRCLIVQGIYISPILGSESSSLTVK